MTKIQIARSGKKEVLFMKILCQPMVPTLKEYFNDDKKLVLILALILYVFYCIKYYVNNKLN